MLNYRFLSYLCLPVFLLFVACSPQKESSTNLNIETNKYQIKESFQSIIDSANTEGSVLIYDLQQDLYFSNDFDWAKKGNLPASTFKITNSIIALETGVVESDSTLFKWDGQPRRIKIWEQDLIFKQAFHFSCVPCYQEVAKKIGSNRMNEYLDKLNYGKMTVDSSNINMFWLEGDSRITQMEQIDFLKRFYQSELPITENTESTMKRLMVIEETENYKLSGKTGWAIRNGLNNGWFVGYIENAKGTYIFATNIEPKEKFNMKMFPMIRKQITFKALEELGII